MSAFRVAATNYLSNSSFTGGSTSWTLSNTGSTSTAYTSKYYQDTAGSVGISTSGKNRSGTGQFEQTISTTIVGGSQVYLSYAYLKTCSTCTTNTTEIIVTPSGGSSTTVYTDTTKQTLDSDWATRSNIDISSYFSTTTTYTLQFLGTQVTGNSTQASAISRFDVINLDVTTPVITASSTGTQTSTTYASTNDQYIGGAFAFVRNFGSTSITSITISQTGTVTSANLTDLKLFYKAETTCSSSIPSGTTQFNSTAGTFSSGTSTVTGSMTVGTSQICLYVQLDIGSGVSPGETIEIQITDPSTQITASAGTVTPSTAVAISGTTTIASASNTAPSFTGFSSNGPVNPGSTITFSATASDSDSENIFLVVCKTQGVSGTSCDGGSSDTWCTSSSVSSNPSCGYSVSSVTPDTTYNTYPYIFDVRNLASTSSYQGTLSTYTISNVTPVVSAVTINGGSNIDLAEGTTKAVTLTATVTDNNSCYGSELSTIYGYVYRSGITYSGCDTAGEANSNNCYPEVSCTVVGGSCTDNTDASANYTCTANLQYYADPTDTSTLYPAQNWLTTIKATDNNSASGNTEVSTGVEVNSLIAFSITTTIDYGNLTIEQSNDPLDRTTVITPLGNVGLDEELSGSNMCSDYPICAEYTIVVGHQRYALSASTTYASATALTGTATTIPIHIPKPTTNSPTTKTTWWGISIPTNTYATTYNGVISVTGVKSSTSYW